MFRNALVIFLLGCITGGGLVWLISADREPSAIAPISATVAGTHAMVQVRAVPMSENATAAKTLETKEPAASTLAISAPAATQVADSAPPAGYNFGEVTNTEQRLDAIFRSERVDQVWASQTVDSLNLVLSAMPERAVIGDYGLTCKESLCKLELRGDPKLFMSMDPKNNVQGALMRMMAEPPASEFFDDSTMNVSSDNDGLATITLFAHRRSPKR
jgi:hypothetical protein